MAYVTIRIWEDTRRLLRLIAAANDEQMVEVMDRLCRQEWERLEREQQRLRGEDDGEEERRRNPD